MFFCPFCSFPKCKWIPSIRQWCYSTNATLNVPNYRMWNNADGRLFRIFLPLSFTMRTSSLLIKTSCRGQTREGRELKLLLEVFGKHWWKFWWNCRNSLFILSSSFKEILFPISEIYVESRKCHVCFDFLDNGVFKEGLQENKVFSQFISNINLYFSSWNWFYNLKQTKIKYFSTNRTHQYSQK